MMSLNVRLFPAEDASGGTLKIEETAQRVSLTGSCIRGQCLCSQDLEMIAIM